MSRAGLSLSRASYAGLYGPTTGDRVRLGDTNLLLRITHDFARYGDEVTFGGGKVLRDGMGQASGIREAFAVDVVITNVIVVDSTGIYKADVGIKNGRIHGIGKAENPARMPGADTRTVGGVATEGIARA